MNSLDRAFVQSKGFTVLDDPEAQNHATPTTLLFAIGYEWSTIEEVFEIAYPAAFIAGDLHDFINCAQNCYADGTPQEERDRVDQEFRKKQEKEFDRVFKPFCDMCLSQDVPLPGNEGRVQKIYWRRTRAD